MADPNAKPQPEQIAPFAIPASPHTFTFGSRTLVGVLTSWSGSSERRHVVHRFPKRKGQRVEDMERDGRWLQVRLLFVGDKCASEAQQLEAFVDQNPVGRLDHPIAGQWTAFCVGPQSAADFNRALNQVELNVRFIETENENQSPVDTPDVGTAAQNVVAQQAVAQQAVATYLGALGKAQTKALAALGAIDNAIGQITSVATSPVTLVQSVVNTALGTTSLIAQALNTIASQTATMNADVTAFLAAATDLFSGSDTNATASADNIANTLNSVLNDALALEATLTASMPGGASTLGGAAPAGAAQSVRDIELLVDMCMTLSDAVIAQLPPVTQYTTTSTQNIIVLSQFLMVKFGIVGRDPLAYASQVMGLNRIPYPGMIPGGTVLTVPTA